MKLLYRSDYIGEYIVKSIIIQDGNRTQNREWVENTINLSLDSDRATCITEHATIKPSFYKQIQNNTGGLLSKNKMITYGVENVWKYMTPDFLISRDKNNLENIIINKYNEDTVVYTSASKCMKYPGVFHLIPYNQSMSAEALSIWLACFDENKEVFIVGYDTENNKLNNIISNIMETYKDVKFYFVSDSNLIMGGLQQHLNFNKMTVREYISYCDI